MQIWVNPPMQILTMEKGAQGITDQQITTPKNSVKLPHHQKDIQCPGSFDKGSANQYKASS